MGLTLSRFNESKRKTGFSGTKITPKTSLERAGPCEVEFRPCALLDERLSVDLRSRRTSVRATPEKKAAPDSVAKANAPKSGLPGT